MRSTTPCSHVALLVALSVEHLGVRGSSLGACMDGQGDAVAKPRVVKPASSVVKTESIVRMNLQHQMGLPLLRAPANMGRNCSGAAAVGWQRARFSGRRGCSAALVHCVAWCVMCVGTEEVASAHALEYDYVFQLPHQPLHPQTGPAVQHAQCVFEGGAWQRGGEGKAAQA